MAAAEKIFEYRSVIPTSMDAMWQFHAAPSALTTLTPPPLFIQIVRNGRVSLTEGEVEFRLWFGPVPVRWLARHEPGATPTSFIDRMLEGPMAVWVHRHNFRAVAGGIELHDQITLRHRSGWRGVLTRLVFDGLPLRVLFAYRHWRTRRATTGK
jgi:ligand-binding SRPBCC domain-containing protein